MKKYLYLLPVRTILFIIIFYIISLITKKDITETSTWWTLAVNIVNIIIIGILLLICKSNNIKFMQLFKKSKNKTTLKEMILIPIIISILALLGMNLAAYLIYNEIPYTPECMFQPIPLLLAICNILILPITTTLAEDGLYIGIGVNNIKNKYLSIIIPLFFYLIQHSFFPLIWDYKFMLFRFLSFLFIILFMCIYYKKKIT